jgi:hypothetical protein
MRSFLQQELFALTGFETQYQELIRQASVNIGSKDAATAQQIQADEKALARRKANVLAALRETGPHSLLKEELDAITNAELELKRSIERFNALRQKTPVVPVSTDDLRSTFQRTFESLAADSYEFADALRKLVDGFWVYLVQLCDGGHLLPRAKVILALDRLLPDMARVPGMAELLRREIDIDLFDPPQRARIRPQVVELRGKGVTERAIVEMIPEKPTLAAVQDSMALHREMVAKGLSSPYVIIHDPPEGYSKLRRHKHPSYRFKPLEGHIPPPVG